MFKNIRGPPNTQNLSSALYHPQAQCIELEQFQVSDSHFLDYFIIKMETYVTPSVVQFWFLNGFGFGSWAGSQVPQQLVLHFEMKSEPEQAKN
jgi:hypothetical protein